jgi:rod shape-determining protein MreD
MRKISMIILVYLLTITFILFQKNILEEIPLFGVTANIGIVFVCIIGAVSGTLVGGTVGFFYGILIDVFWGRTLGLYALIYMLLGYTSGLFHNKIAMENKLSFAIIVSVGTVITELILSLMMSIFYDVNVDLVWFIKLILLEIIYNLILGVFLYNVLLKVGEQINKAKKSYYVLN